MLAVAGLSQEVVDEYVEDLTMQHPLTGFVPQPGEDPSRTMTKAQRKLV